MKKMCVFILPFSMLCAEPTMAVYPTQNQSFKVNESFGATDSGAVPETWLKLSKLNLGTASSISAALSPCDYQNFMCTVGSINLGYNGKASYILNIYRYAATITDDAGNSYVITIAFPDGSPAIGIYEHNSQGGRQWNSLASYSGSKFLSPPDSARDTGYVFGSAQGYCGNISGCVYSVGAYSHSNSSMPYVYMKLPKNLSATSVSFKDINVFELQLSIGNQAGNSVNPITAKLYLSGTISIPQRCYIKADKNSFDFGTVYSNSDNGILKNMSASVTTDCYYAPDNTQQYLKMEAVSGGALNSSSMIYQIASDSALGMVFNINNDPNCNATTDNKNVFNKEYLIRTITYQQHLSATDKLNFSLCKYGVPSVTGQKNVVLRLTSRWVVN
ncbi:hypothetical protein K4C27_003776 [Escherichia coli]|nr:hypothetical protein [Escherichia coli]MCI5377272.1 hypothetical protein [Escherichia coli]